MPIYRIADFYIDLAPRYELVPRIAAPYLAPDQGVTPDLVIRVSEQTVAEALESDPSHTPAYAESICTYRAICNGLSPLGAILFHAAAVKVDGRAYAFSAPSGTGKSTHISLWRKLFGARVDIINGDKPLIREKDGVFTVYGTPWCGKEGWHRNDQAPLAGVCFLKRGTENCIRRLSAAEAVDKIFAQLLKPKTPEGVAETLRLADLFIRNIPIWELSCDISRAAAECSFRAMTGLLPD